MKEVYCTRGFGIITDPETGEEYHVAGDKTIEVRDDVATRLAAISGVVVEDTAPDTFRCGVNDCSREVDTPDAVCWQHE